MPASSVSDTPIGFLNLLRATACLLVVYCHLIGERADPGWFVKPYIDQYVVVPLTIMWNFGFLGVAIFFIISGFIITHIAQRESRSEFIIKRMFRIYPPFVAALGLSLVLAFVLNRPEIPGSIDEFMLQLSLFGSNFKLIGPSYTLVIELVFYAIVAVLLPSTRSNPAISTLIVALLPVFTLLALKQFVLESGVHQFFVLLAYSYYISLFAIGMAIYYGWSKRLSPRSVIFLVAVSWCALVWTTGPSVDGRAFQVNTLYGLLVFLAALWAKPQLHRRSFIVIIATGSYSLYLIHSFIGGFLVDRLRATLGYSMTLLVVMPILAISCWVFYNYIEKPSQAAGRKLAEQLKFSKRFRGANLSARES